MPAAIRHTTPFTGSWYPGQPAELRALLERLFEASERRTGPYLAPEGAAFVVPHAGLIYSGTVAAAAYRHIRSLRPERVFLLGFAHRGAPSGVWIPEVDAYLTPLGETEVDWATAAELIKSGACHRICESALCDHSVEIQLPLLQAAAPEAKLVPLYVSALDAARRAAAAKALAALAGPRTVCIASSDFTHYGRGFSYQPFPPDDLVADRLSSLDHGIIEAVGSLDSELFFESLRKTSSTMCGYEPVGLLLEMLCRLGGDREIFQALLDYQTSGEIMGDYRQSVSYAALGFFPHDAFRLGAEDRALLLDAARRTLDAYLETGRRVPQPPARRTPALERRAAAFVTLHCRGELRGCVGRHAVSEPLAETVPALTLAAALDDTRFAPVARGESGFEIEISILSPFKRVRGPDRVQAGIHGAMLEAGIFRGLLLPQVAGERNWTASQFLEALARKTGVTRQAYRDPATRLHVFRAQVFAESRPEHG
jgi:AmmeMemoRadiSam system protein B/AmmeMemoRadiSam system protein A